MMKLSDFIHQMRQEDRPVILLEGTRDVPEPLHPALIALGSLLARELPEAVFRSGNAEGSDALFAQGVNAVDPRRLELVTPTAGHRKKHRHTESYVVPLDQISPMKEEKLAYLSNQATPGNQRIIEQRNGIPRLKAKARYLLRDTLKVIGDAEQKLAPATAGIFFTKPDPMSGGTGHTIRVCRQEGVPVYLQADWWEWLDR